MRYVSLFSGAGGFDLGLDAAGLTCVAQVEIDRTARAVLARRWPDVPKHKDVRAVGRHNLPACDVVVGGFPCQDLSVAGKRAGLQAGERSGLWWEMLRVVRELRPGVVVWENVPGLLTSDGGRDHWRVCSSLAECGYFGAWRVLDAQFFGVPQRRRRVFGVFVSGRAGAGRAAEILALTQGVCRHPAAGREAGAGVAACLTSGSHGGGSNAPGRRREDDVNLVAFTELGESHATYQPSDTAMPVCTNGGGGSQNRTLLAFGGGQTTGERRGNPSPTAKGGAGRQDFDTETFVIEDCSGRMKNQNGAGVRHTGPAYTLDTRGLQGIAHTLRAEGFDASEDGTGRGTPLVPAGPLYYSHDYNQDRVYPADGVTPALTAADSNRTRNHLVAGGVRRLTPRECERLMGWPDDHTRWRADGTEIADGPRYRMCGNGVVANVAEWIGRRLAVTQGEG